MQRWGVSVQVGRHRQKSGSLDPATGKELELCRSYHFAQNHRDQHQRIGMGQRKDLLPTPIRFQKEVGPHHRTQAQELIEGVVDLTGLKAKVAQIPNSLNVLNGVAYHPQREKLFYVTGKNWSKLFEVTLQKK